MVVTLGLLVLAGPALFARPGGVIVDRVPVDSPAYAAGVREGDLIQGWIRPPNPPVHPEGDEGPIRTAFGWWHMEVEQGPRGPVILTGERDGEEIRHEVFLEDWGATVRPRMTEDLLKAYGEGERLQASGRIHDGIQAWERLARKARIEGRFYLSFWLYLQTIRAWSKAGEGDGVRRVSIRLHHMVWGHTETAAHVDFWETLAAVLTREGSLRDVRTAREAALEIVERHWKDSLLMARTLDHLAATLREQGFLEGAESRCREALRLRRTLAPGTRIHAESLEHLGNLLLEQDRGGEAVVLFGEALDLRRSRRDERGHVVRLLQRLGDAARAAGTSEKADEWYREALAEGRDLDPHDPYALAALRNLGIMAYHRGDLLEADRFLSRVERALRGGSFGGDSAALLADLARTAEERGDLTRAENLWKEVLPLVVAEEHAGRRIEVLEALAAVRRAREDRAGAVEALRQALSLRKAEGDRSLSAAAGMRRLGISLIEAERFGEAEPLLEKARSILKEKAPESIDLVSVLQALGDMAAERDWELAQSYQRAALELVRGIAPGSPAEAEALIRLAEVTSARGYGSLTEEYLERASEIAGARRPEDLLAARIHRSWVDLWLLAGKEKKAVPHMEETLAVYDGDSARFLASLGDADAVGEEDSVAAVALFLDRKMREEALDTLEALRSRRLASMMTARDPVFQKDLPAALDARRRIHRTLARRLRAEMGWATGGTEEEWDALREDWRAFRLQGESLAAEVASASPFLAGRLAPEAAALRRFPAELEPGTVCIAYVVEGDRTWIFIMGPDGKKAKAKKVKVAAYDLARRVEALRAAIGGREDVTPLSTNLSEVLLEPVKGRMKKARRLVICPCGPLRRLPFGALADPLAKRKSFRFLGESYPIRMADSLSLFLLARPAKGGGSPFPGPFEFTGEGTRGGTPLEYGLLPDEGRGGSTLRAMDVLERRRFYGGLVTAPLLWGREGITGDMEGPLSLERAFLLAGARGVVSALWEPPGECRQAFQEALAEGMGRGLPADMALQKAVASMAAEDETAHPVHWAGWRAAGPCSGNYPPAEPEKKRKKEKEQKQKQKEEDEKPEKKKGFFRKMFKFWGDDS